MRFPREGLLSARGRVPARVELAAGLAAYDTHFLGQGDTMRTAADSARQGGANRLRHWSGKWLCRLKGATARRAKLDAIARDFASYDTQPPPGPTVIEQAYNDVLRAAQRLKSTHPAKAEQLARDADRLVD